MISIFRKIRQKLLQENRFTRYLVYAIGEILLVTIGILIALSINTWNESRKEKNYLLKVYAQIRQDLQADTLNLRLSIEDLEAKNIRITEIIERSIPVAYYDTLNEANYKYCEKCISDITNLEPFQYLDKG
jgi:sulfur transfer complex TusBCD TusB component (DsrH family)